MLRMLSGREMYGYEIVKAMRLVTGEAIGFGEGVVYPVLHCARGRRRAESAPQERQRARARLLRGHDEGQAPARAPERRMEARQLGRELRAERRARRSRACLTAQFESLRLELLRSGVTPLYVERTILELERALRRPRERGASRPASAPKRRPAHAHAALGNERADRGRNPRASGAPDLQHALAARRALPALGCDDRHAAGPTAAVLHRASARARALGRGRRRRGNPHGQRARRR